MHSKKSAISLINDMIIINQALDERNKKSIESGDSWNVYHLKLLKLLVEEIQCPE